MRAVDGCDAVTGAMSALALFKPAKDGGESELKKLYAALPLDPALENMRCVGSPPYCLLPLITYPPEPVSCNI